MNTTETVVPVRLILVACEGSAVRFTRGIQIAVPLGSPPTIVPSRRVVWLLSVFVRSKFRCWHGRNINQQVRAVNAHRCPACRTPLRPSEAKARRGYNRVKL